jgi:hypothetical protein
MLTQWPRLARERCRRVGPCARRRRTSGDLVVTLRQGHAGAAGTDAASPVAAGKSLAAIHDRTFLFGPGLVLGVNTLLLAPVMYLSAGPDRP